MYWQTNVATASSFKFGSGTVIILFCQKAGFHQIDIDCNIAKKAQVYKDIYYIKIFSLKESRTGCLHE